MKPQARRHATQALAAVALASAAALVSSCVHPVGPDHRKPNVSAVVPTQWSWQPAQPMDHVPKGAWWRVFNDPVLDDLEARALQSSPGLQAALARVQQARARARASAVDLFPDARLRSGFERQRTSGNLPTPIPVNILPATFDGTSIGFDLSYELDLWGKVRRMVESSRAEAAATDAEFNNLSLSLSADVAAQYFAIRSLDAEVAAHRAMLRLRDEGVGIAQQRLAAGVITEAVAQRARSERAAAAAALADATRAREEAAANLAFLCGQAAGAVVLPEAPMHERPPAAIPAGLPAHLLERRPDVAAAERMVAARNAEIGVAMAAYFPSIRLTGSGGQLSRDIDSLFSADSRTWSVGPSVSLPLTGYALAGARVRHAKAGQEEAVARYRQAVLGAIRDVEASLAQVRRRAEQADALANAADQAAAAAALARQRLDAGITSRSEWIEAEHACHESALRRVQAVALQHVAAVRLVKALGGGWE